MDSLVQFYSEAEKILDAFEYDVNAYGLADHLIADHLNWKCSSPEHFKRMKTLFETLLQGQYQTLTTDERAAIIAVRNPAKYQNVRNIFESGDEFIYESQVGGRRIALIGIKPIGTPLGDIKLIELSDQKPETEPQQVDGFDHIEAYPIPEYDDKEKDYNALVNRLESKGLVLKKEVRPHHTTHDIKTDSGLLLRLSHVPLLEKVLEELAA